MKVIMTQEGVDDQSFVLDPDDPNQVYAEHSWSSSYYWWYGYVWSFSWNGVISTSPSTTKECIIDGISYYSSSKVPDTDNTIYVYSMVNTSGGMWCKVWLRINGVPVAGSGFVAEKGRKYYMLISGWQLGANGKTYARIVDEQGVVKDSAMVNEIWGDGMGIGFAPKIRTYDNWIDDGGRGVIKWETSDRWFFDKFKIGVSGDAYLDFPLERNLLHQGLKLDVDGLIV